MSARSSARSSRSSRYASSESRTCGVARPVCGRYPWQRAVLGLRAPESSARRDAPYLADRLARKTRSDSLCAPGGSCGPASAGHDIVDVGDHVTLAVIGLDGSLGPTRSHFDQLTLTEDGGVPTLRTRAVDATRALARRHETAARRRTDTDAEAAECGDLGGVGSDTGLQLRTDTGRHRKPGNDRRREGVVCDEFDSEHARGLRPGNGSPRQG